VLDVYLCRHSHVDYGPGGSSTPQTALTPVGQQMAARLAERCEAWDLQYLFASTMLRAQQTADAISARWPALPRLDLPEFEETHLGDLQDYPGELPSDDVLTWQMEHFRHGNRQLFRRVSAGWQKVLGIVAQANLERIAIVGHGGTLNGLLRLFQGCTAESFGRCWFEFDWTATCGVRFTDGYCWVRWVNDAHHIDPLRPLLGDAGPRSG
jgi:broad specificity phosphatase PhoE